MKHLDSRDKEIWEVCRLIMLSSASLLGLKLRKMKVLSDKKDFYGDCSTDGHIRIQLRRNGQRLLAYQVIDTLAHEMAHLRHNNHGPAWFKLHCQILSDLSRSGFYRDFKKLYKNP